MSRTCSSQESGTPIGASGISRTSPLEFLASTMPMVSASVDRLNQVPARLAFLFGYDADRVLGDRDLLEEMRSGAARSVVTALADVLAESPRLDREGFRAAANQVKVRSEQKGRALFHPIRVVLTGRAEGPELDLAVPAIDRGAELDARAGVPPIRGCRERAAAFREALHRR